MRRRIVLLILLVVMLGVMATLGVLFVSLRAGTTGPPPLETPGLSHVTTLYGWGDDVDSLLKEPYSVAWKNGSLYITEKGRSDVVRLTPDGELLRTYGERGREPGQIWAPSGLAVDDQGTVYVTDGGHSKVVAYEDAGTLRNEFTVSDAPLAMVVDGNRLFLTGAGTVKVLSLPDGAEISSWGSRGRGDAQFDYPNGIAFDPGSQLILVADGNNLRVKALDLQGNVVWVYGRPPKDMNDKDRAFGLTGGLAVANGHVFVTDPLDSLIHILDMEGNKVAEVGAPGTADGEFAFPSSIAYMGGNRFAIVEWANQRVQIVDIDVAQAAAQWRPDTTSTSTPGDEAAPPGSTLTTVQGG